MADSTTTTVQSTGYPSWIEDQMKNAANIAGGLYTGRVILDANGNPIGVEGGPQDYVNNPTAGLSSQQQTVSNMADQLVGNTGNQASSDFLNSLLTGGQQINASPVNAAQVGATPGATAQQAQGANASADKINFGYTQQLTNMVNNNQSNPYLAKMVAAAIQPVSQEYSETVMPSLKSGAQAAGRYGGTANALMMANAAQDYGQNIGDISAKMYGTAYDSDRNRALQAMGLGGQLATSQAQFGTQANIASAQNQTQAAIQNALMGTDVSKYNSQLGYNTALANAGYLQDINKYNQTNDLNAQGANIANMMAGTTLNNANNQSQWQGLNNLWNIGATQREIEQAGLTDTRNEQLYNQAEPLSRYNNYLQELLAIGGQNKNTTTTGATNTDDNSDNGNTWSDILGALSGAAGVGSLIW